jgi:hypothetical protein
MPGVRVFHALKEAIDLGYHIYDKISGGGYLLRIKTDAGWALAVCEPKKDLADPDECC